MIKKRRPLLGRLAMSLARILKKSLERRGVLLDYLRHDFDDRPLDDYTRRRMLGAMANAYEQWVSDQQVFDVVNAFSVEETVSNFFNIWTMSPFRIQQGGSRFNNLLWLHLIAKSMNPDIIVDSGTFQGASAWALSLGSPDSKTLSFDINLSNLVLKSDGVLYTETDWSYYLFDVSSSTRVLAYFDDHVDQIKRVIEASDRGCAVAIFDDDYSITSYFGMAPHPDVLPKIEFLLDRDLTHGQILRWIGNGAEHSFVVDRDYLDRGRDCIASTERLPNTSLITGIHQTPYRIVSIRKPEQAI